MELEEGASFLLRRAKVVMLDAPLDSAPNDDLENALAITLAMDSLPLALDKAGAYIEDTNCALSDYLNLYHTRRSGLLKRRGKVAFDHPESVTTTFSLSPEKVQQANAHAVELLKFCSFLYRP